MERISAGHWVRVEVDYTHVPRGEVGQVLIVRGRPEEPDSQELVVLCEKGGPLTLDRRDVQRVERRCVWEPADATN